MQDTSCGGRGVYQPSRRAFVQSIFNSQTLYSLSKSEVKQVLKREKRSIGVID